MQRSLQTKVVILREMASRNWLLAKLKQLVLSIRKMIGFRFWKTSQRPKTNSLPPLTFIPLHGYIK
jgi:hypothetical protein